MGERGLVGDGSRHGEVRALRGASRRSAIGQMLAFTLACLPGCRNLGGGFANATTRRRAGSADAEIISALEFIPAGQRGAIAAGTSQYDCTEDLAKAIDHVRASGGTLRFPAGTYLVSTFAISGANFRIETAPGVRFQQRRGLANGDTHCIVSIRDASNIEIGDLHLVGNIATDLHEYSHGLGIGPATNIGVGKVVASDIRGDGVYCYGRTAAQEMLRDIRIARISGGNIFRNLLTVVGGEVRVGELVNDGPVGYRDFDVEPNDAGGSYQPVDLEIGVARVGTVEITSDDTKVINRSVRIGVLDADNNRVRPTTPPYPRGPGRGAYALGVNHVASVQIGQFTARNYNGCVIALSTAWSSLHIGTLDIANCALQDRTYGAMIVQYRNAGSGRIVIDNLLCDAAKSKYLARVQDAGLLSVEVNKILKMRCMPGTGLTGRFANGTIDLNGGGGVAVIASRKLTFENIRFANAASATGFSDCDEVMFIRSTIALGKLYANGGRANFTGIDTVFNGIHVARGPIG